MAAVDYRAQTTLITGASAGIGEQFSRRLAALGSDLVLVARREDRLERLAEELRAAHGVRVHVVAIDLAQANAGAALAENLARAGVRVTSVINNAGFGTYGLFHEEDPQRLRQEIALDVMAVVDISRAFITQLRAAGHGFLLNVASMAAYQPNPRMAVYGAAKAFVLNFTEALWEESRGSGLRVMAFSPGATRTEFFDVVGTEDAAGGTTLRSPVEVVENALAALGRKRTPPSMASGRMNRVVAAVMHRVLPRRRIVQIMGRMTTPKTKPISA
ncbi:SDR family NAD(P)-dependent oxidoreductase [Umezawaea endophytica]|uniref:SDR family oxidoreductase n=1 Tax=Umezawaea endophytica TaxID=1654476 RepID=A0A9X2VUB6_9PSEU|nr:SDR family oxidoreductase [Umezawaea endophytica]MCS7482502.1 SDR family oxidoreductase [Umezawaea endophytica]